MYITWTHSRSGSKGAASRQAVWQLGTSQQDDQQLPRHTRQAAARGRDAHFTDTGIMDLVTTGFRSKKSVIVGGAPRSFLDLYHITNTRHSPKDLDFLRKAMLLFVEPRCFRYPAVYADIC